MNLFRLAGDMTHLMSILVVLLKIRATKSCRGARGGPAFAPLRLPGTPNAPLSIPDVRSGASRGPPAPPMAPPAGVSLKTQELYALVFVCRYLDLFYSYISL